MKKKGFTLIELMIVLSVIGLLAVMLTPRLGSTKDSIKNNGVIVNANSVRHIIEDNSYSQYVSPSYLTSVFNGLTGDDAIINPFTKNNTCMLYTSYAAFNAGNLGSIPVSPGIYIYSHTNGGSGAVDSISTYSWSQSIVNYSLRGCIIVICYNDGYAVVGLDGTGTKAYEEIVK